MATKKKNDGMPQVRAYPKCSECGTPFVLRMCFHFGAGGIAHSWLWQRDCKHKKAEAEIVEEV